MNAKLPTSMENKDNTDKNSGSDASIGSLLRASRNRRNEELSEVSSDLRIRQVYLEALENNNFDVLPGAIYAIGFIRSYAEYLGLDGEEIVRRYKSEASLAEKKPDLTFPSLVPEHGIPGGAIVMLGLVLAAIAYGSWYFVSSRNVYVTEQVPAVPEKSTSLVGEKPVATGSVKTTENATRSAAAASVEKKPAPETKIKTEKPEEKVDVKVEKKIDPVASGAPKLDASGAPKLVVSGAPKIESETVKKDVSTEPVPKIVKVEVTKPAPKPDADLKPADVKPADIKPNAPKPAQDASVTLPKTEPKPETKPDLKPKAASKVEPEPNAKPKTETKPVIKAPEKVVEKVDKKPTGEPAAVKKVEPKPKATPKRVVEVAKLPPTNAAIKPTVKPTDKPAAIAPGSSRITLRAVTDSYIQVRDNDANQLIITRLLKKGQSYQVPNRSGLSLITGNAGALEILVDGTVVPSIGPIGAVRRNVSLEAEKLINGSAVVE